MWKYILKRIIALIPVIIGVTLIVYFIMSLAPGDPATTILGDQATPEAIAQLREEMGLNDPIIVQYARYMINLARGDMGTSYKTKKPVSIEVFSRFPATAKLSLVAVTFSTLLAIPLGMLAAVKQNSFFDGFSMIIALLGISMPIFWFGVLEQLDDALVLRGEIVQLRIRVARLVVALRQHVVRGHALQQRWVARTAGVGRLDGDCGRLGLARRLGRLYGAFDVVRVKGIDGKQLFGLGHGLHAIALLHQAHDLGTRQGVLDLLAESVGSALAETRDLRGTQKPPRLKRVRRAGQRLVEHLNGKVVPPGLKRLSAAIR